MEIFSSTKKRRVAFSLLCFTLFSSKAAFQTPSWWTPMRYALPEELRQEEDCKSAQDILDQREYFDVVCAGGEGWKERARVKKSKINQRFFHEHGVNFKSTMWQLPEDVTELKENKEALLRWYKERNPHKLFPLWFSARTVGALKRCESEKANFSVKTYEVVSADSFTNPFPHLLKLRNYEECRTDYWEQADMFRPSIVEEKEAVSYWMEHSHPLLGS